MQRSTLNRIELGENQSSVTDCIDSYIVPASMCSASRKIDLDPYEPAMRRTNRETSRLG
jgi:hypothetical protein